MTNIFPRYYYYTKHEQKQNIKRKKKKLKKPQNASSEAPYCQQNYKDIAQLQKILKNTRTSDQHDLVKIQENGGLKWISPWHQLHLPQKSETVLQLRPSKESLLLYRCAPLLSPSAEQAWRKNIKFSKRDISDLQTRNHFYFWGPMWWRIKFRVQTLLWKHAP